jgi:hypothetical protein
LVGQLLTLSAPPPQPDEVWLRQQAKGGWRRHPRAADALAKGQLSSDCVDLLDGLLHYDEVR